MSKKTKQAAQNEVPSYIQPATCFIVYMNNATGWASFAGPPFNGTPCAHYVSHILGIKASHALGGYGCNDGYELRVRALLAQLNQIDAASVAVNDVWGRLKGDTNATNKTSEPTDHCGIVYAVEDLADGTRKIGIRHNSSGQRKVAENDWSYFGNGGKFYRLQSTTPVTPGTALNMVRSRFGIPIKQA